MSWLRSAHPRQARTRSRRRLRLALAFAAAAGAACASLPPPPQERVEPPEPYRVGASDVLSLRILPDPPIEGSETVRPDGRITVDLIGDVDAAGRTTEEIAEEIQRRIAQYRQGPLATVSVETANSASIAVLGEVRTPGRHPITQETRLSEAIALAGGATQLAAASRVRLIRWEGDRTVAYEADLDEIQDGEGSTNVVLVEGDLVFVPPATPVAVGYMIRRALYPLEVVIGTVAGAVLGFFAGGG